MLAEVASIAVKDTASSEGECERSRDKLARASHRKAVPGYLDCLVKAFAAVESLAGASIQVDNAL